VLALDIKSVLQPGSRVLCIGAHCDDIEIGCGGSMLKWLASSTDIHVDWLVLSGSEVRDREALTSAAIFLRDAASSEIIIKSFRNGFFPAVLADLKMYFEDIKQRPAPDLILTHYRHDLHQDHRVVNELTWNTFRNHLILEYEIPKYDGDLGQPNVYVEIDQPTADAKITALMDSFASERDKNWFDERTFHAMLRLRGVECQSVGGLAEAFHGRKILI